jgi:hypothetical protein
VVSTGKKEDEVAESVPVPTSQVLGEMARRYHMYVVVSIDQRDGAVVYNTALLIDHVGKVAGKYRKTHLPEEEVSCPTLLFFPLPLDVMQTDPKNGLPHGKFCYVFVNKLVNETQASMDSFRNGLRQVEPPWILALGGAIPALQPMVGSLETLRIESDSNLEGQARIQ